MRRLFLNELSLVSSPHPAVASESMSDFVSCLRSASSAMRSVCLISPTPFAGSELAPGFRYEQWRTKAENRDADVFIHLLMGKAPSFDYEDLNSRAYQYFLVDTPTLGLAAAYEEGCLAVSIAGSDALRTPNLQLRVEELKTTDEGGLELTTKSVSVTHGWEEDLSPHYAWLDEQRLIEDLDALSATLSADDVASRCSYIDILPDAFAQLSHLTGDFQRRAIATLLSLNESVAEWSVRHLAWPEWRTKVTPESQSRLNRGLVEFTDMDGQRSDFSLHARFTPGAGRIHFILDLEARRIRVGYVGLKLV